jgi:hypothetical protein
MTARFIRSSAFALLLIIGFSLPGYCDEISVCKTKVSISNGTLAPSNLPAGFQLFVPDTPVFLSGVSVFDGPPAEGALLKPTSISPHGESVVWELSPSSSAGTWISCDYADGLVRLVKKLEQPAADCTATISKTRPPKGIEARFLCKP